MNNKYNLDVKKIHETIIASEGAGLNEIDEELKEQGYYFDNNNDANAVSALISLYDFVNFCETSDDEYFSNRFDKYWELYVEERDKVLDDLGIGKEVAWDSDEYLNNFQDNIEK